MRLFYWASTFLVKGLLKILARWEVRGKENVPPHGPLIVVANHLNYSDPPIVSASLPRRVVFMAKVELFHSWGRFFVRAFGAFPARKKSPDKNALRRSFKVLEQGLALGIFPEGTRSRDGKLQPAFLGAAMIAMRSRAPLLPVGITGTEKLRGIGWVFRRPRITVSIGKPFYPPDSHTKVTKEALKEFTDVIMCHIARLLPPEYHGVYDVSER